jgi:dipeptidyl aminopeptidase/acylaminoacyl peptidase
MRTRSFVLVALVSVSVVVAAPGQSTWKTPPKNVVDVLDAPPTPRMVVSPDGARGLLVSFDPYPPLEMLARPFLKLAGHRIDPVLGSRQRTTRSRGLEVLDFQPVARRRIALPADASINSIRWSHDGKRFAFTNDVKDGVELWVGDAEKGEAHPIEDLRVNDILGAPFSWNADGESLLVRAVAKGRGKPPERPAVPDGPAVEEAAGKVSKVMTFQDLLKNQADEAQFEWYATVQLMNVDVAGNARPIGKPAIFTDADWSGDGKHLLVKYLKRPFSYRVPSSRFASAVEVWSPDAVVEKVIADLPVADEVPPQGVPTGPRSVQWMATSTDTLVWAEALDGGDPTKKVPHRDKLMMSYAPFVDVAPRKGAPIEVTRLTHRYSGIAWTGKPGEALVTEFDRDRRWTRSMLMSFDPGPSMPAEKLGQVIFDRSVNDSYGDPGSPVMEEQRDGSRIMVRDHPWAYFAGAGASEEGDRPFLDRIDLKTKAKERVWQSSKDAYETFVHFVKGDRSSFIIRSESRTEPANYYLVNAKGERVKLTDFKDPAPELTKVRKELLKYKRADGCQLTGTLYLPPDYKEGTKLPLVVWAYPEEYSDAGTAGQVRGSTKTFTRLQGDSPLFFLLNGYAVLMDATMPVIGDPERMNDTFVEQIVSSAQAAIEKVASMGVADPNRCVVSGHSYGAFMTANLLAHSDLFAAGIARSGAYNRSLTPFGFQSERRSYWEATEVYTKVSPFTYANKINEPLLLIHGDADNNPGTHTMQSERLFQAIRGHGGIARLVLLPYESHGYRARESVLHVIAEMFDWADKYVKNKGP